MTPVPETGSKPPGRTYTFVNAASDGDEGVGQSAAASAVLWLRGRVVAEDPLDVEAQHETHQAAGLAALRGRDQHTHTMGQTGVDRTNQTEPKQSGKPHLNISDPGSVQKFHFHLRVS